jgi:hypothetical protein
MMYSDADLLLVIRMYLPGACSFEFALPFLIVIVLLRFHRRHWSRGRRPFRNLFNVGIPHAIDSIRSLQPTATVFPFASFVS